MHETIRSGSNTISILLLEHRVDGIVVTGSRTDARRPLREKVPVPTIYAYNRTTNPEDPVVIGDDYRGGEIAVEHLLEIGRTRIAYVGGDPGYCANTDRYAGVKAALDRAGLELVGPVQYGPWSEVWGRAAAPAVFESKPDGIVAAADSIGRGVLEAAREKGIRVPDDIAVVSFDNWNVMVDSSRPNLTTIDPRLDQIGRRTAERLYEVINGTGEPTGLEKITPRLIVRGSTVAGA